MSEDAKTAAKRQAIEAEGIDVAKQAIKGTPKAAEVKRSRFEKRLENRKKAILDKIVLQYFTERSVLSDPEGIEAAQWFDIYENSWRWECKTFNRGRQPFKLRYEAFSESVEFYLKMEQTQMIKTQTENQIKDFDHWMRRRKVWRTMPLTALWFWIKAFGKETKVVGYWLLYYKSIMKNNATN